jgi:hypothetical protein
LANRSHLKFIGGSDITVRDLRITGANTTPGRFTHAYNSLHGILLAGVKGALIEGCTITNVYGDSVNLGNERPGRINSPCEDIFVVNNTATGSGRQGMTLCYRTNIWFVGNTIGTHRPCFLAARGRAPVNDVVVSGNSSTAAGLGIQAGHKHMRQGGWVVEGNHSTEKNGA